MTAGVDLEKVVASNLPAIVRLTALQLFTSNQSYSKPGLWLKALPDYDLVDLIAMSEEITNELDSKVTEAFVALTMILMQAEGVPFEEGDLRPHVGALVHFLIMEGLARQGLIEVSHNNISFGDDAGALEVARVKEHAPQNSPPEATQ